MERRGSSQNKTTASAQVTTGRGSAHMRAVGYVRVSTEVQVSEGVSLEAQKAKLSAFCKLHDIELIRVCCDEGLSANTLKRPGLAAALRLLDRGEAQAIIVVKLDRLTRSVKDLGFLCEQYFTDGKPWSLLSVTDSIDTRSASGKLILNVLTSVAQWEREAISDRTREAMQHLKQRGVALGSAPFGYVYSTDVDSAGRRQMVESPEAMATLWRIVEMHKADISPSKIARHLRSENVPSPRGGEWCRASVRRILLREGRDVTPQNRRKFVGQVRTFDKERTLRLATEYQRMGMSLREIGRKLDEAGLAPARGGEWHAAIILRLLDPQPSSKSDLPDVRVRARQLHEQGYSFRVIGSTLWTEGYRPENANAWHNGAVSRLLSADTVPPRRSEDDDAIRSAHAI